MFRAAVLTAPLATLAAPALADERFTLSGGCGQVMGFADGAEQDAMEFALVFMSSGMAGALPIETSEAFDALRWRFVETCFNAPPGTTFFEALELVSENYPEEIAAAIPEPLTIEQEAEALLRAFLEPGADTMALTRQLRPSDDEVRAIFSPAIADDVIAYVNQVYSGGAIEPNPGQTDLLVWVAATDDINRATPAMDEFPGGYRALRGLVMDGLPVVRFKFVEPGEELGLSFDGLYRVNGRWVMVPKAYRIAG